MTTLRCHVRRSEPPENRGFQVLQDPNAGKCRRRHSPKIRRNATGCPARRRGLSGCDAACAATGPRRRRLSGHRKLPERSAASPEVPSAGGGGRHTLASAGKGGWPSRNPADGRRRHSHDDRPDHAPGLAARNPLTSSQCRKASNQRLLVRPGFPRPKPWPPFW